MFGMPDDPGSGAALDEAAGRDSGAHRAQLHRGESRPE